MQSTIVGNISKIIARKKESLLHVGVIVSIIDLIYIIILEGLLGMFCLPLFLSKDYTKEPSIFNQEGFSYSKFLIRRKITLTTLASIIAFVGVYAATSLSVFFYHLPTTNASTTNGTIDSVSRYAWSENAGWIDFGDSQGYVTISDTGLSGYAWGENIGWISLNCANTATCDSVNYSVSNTSGTLSGYAWSENAGWINFAPTNGGVFISAIGEFSGYAWGENIGWIAFNCDDSISCGTVNYNITTDYVPANSRQINVVTSTPTTTPSPSPAASTSVPNTPININTLNLPTAFKKMGAIDNEKTKNKDEGGIYVSINKNEATTTAQTVTLSLFGGSEATSMAVSNDPKLINTPQEPYKTIKTWSLVPGAGMRTVYVRFFTKNGVASQIISDSITVVSSTSTPNLVSPNKPITQTLKLGSNSIQVKTLQEFLNRNGFIIAKKNAGSPGKETTYFGPSTKNALQTFQKKYKISSELGYVGPLTQAFLNQNISLPTQAAPVIKEVVSSTPATLPTTSTPKQVFSLHITRTLRLGMKGNDIKALQTALASDASIYPEKAITGILDDATERAVGRFQLFTGIIRTEADAGFGIVGPKTAAKLNDIFK